MGLYEYIFQIHDSVKDISSIKEQLDEQYIELHSDLLIVVESFLERR
ncbi:MAG: hypothetical protein R2827_05515 [Bdellovibrionales bacterium]